MTDIEKVVEQLAMWRRKKFSLFPEDVMNMLVNFDQLLIFSGHLGYQGGVSDLKMLDKVNNGADYKQTSIAVGQKLVDVYVKPMLDKNTNKDK